VSMVVCELEYVVLVTREIWHDVRSEDLVNVAESCEAITPAWANILEDHNSKSLVKSDSAPNHDTWTAPWGSLHHTNVCVTFAPPSPDRGDLKLGNKRHFIFYTLTFMQLLSIVSLIWGLAELTRVCYLPGREAGHTDITRDYCRADFSIFEWFTRCKFIPDSINK